MRALRPISLASGIVVAAVVAAMGLAVPLGTIVDRGPSGAGRLTAFPLALTLSDEVSSGAIRNGAILAGVVAVLSLVIGVGLAQLVSGRRFRGRDALIALANAPGAVPPIFAGFG